LEVTEMAIDWVIYSESVDPTFSEPRGMLHCLDADSNEYPCGTVISMTRDWPLEVALAALAEHPAEVGACPVCAKVSALFGA
jgi:hypothetical protein